jgi:hypothetical protein
VSDGALRPTDEYADVRYYLVAIEDGRIARKNAAKQINASETTVKRILHDPERRRRYALGVCVDQ